MSAIVFPFICIYMQTRCFSTLDILDVSVIHIYVLSLISGSDIVQWMIKNLDIEDQGKRADQY